MTELTPVIGEPCADEGQPRWTAWCDDVCVGTFATEAEAREAEIAAVKALARKLFGA